MAYFETKVLDNQVKALPTYKTVSGDIVTFNTDMIENLISCVAYVNATQQSGTPTPTDPKTITGYNLCVLSVNGNSVLIALGQYVYGGYIDFVSRRGVLTHQLLTLDGTEDFLVISSGTSRRFRSDTLYSQFSNMQLSSHFVESTNNFQPWGYYRFISNYLVLMDNNEQMADVIALQNWLADQYSNGTPVQFLCELVTPINFSGTSSVISIPTIIGSNTISSDHGDMKEVKYILSVGEALS